MSLSNEHPDMSGSDNGMNPEDWIDCKYCTADPGTNGSFYCEECLGQGGRWREEPDFEDCY